MTKKAEDDIVERLVIGDIRKCPLDDRSCDLRPEDPCPVCGDLGTFDILNGPSKCVEVSSRLLRNEAAAEITRLRAREAELVDKIDGLDSDLRSAVEEAFKRGATEWTRLNYPDWFRALTAQQEGDGDD